MNVYSGIPRTSPSKIKDIDSIENVQRRATKMLPKLKDMSHE